MWGKIRKLLIVLSAIVFSFFSLGLVLSKLGVLPPPGNKQPPKFLEKFTVQQSDYFADTSDLPSCGVSKELLSLPPVELDDFTSITPLGLLAPTAHVFPAPHLYLRIRTVGDNPEGLPVEVPVVAPSKLTVTNVKYIEAPNRPEFNDGFVSFGVCKEFKVYFDHLKSFSPKIQEAFDQSRIKQCSEYSLSYQPPIGKVDYKLCQKKVKVVMEKGEAIGTAGGGDGQKAFDFGAVDKRVRPKQFANPDRWATRKQLAYSVCPLDYYAEPLKSQLKARLGGDGQSGKVTNADCGEVVQDIPNTAMGVWVPPETSVIDHDPPNLALAHGFIEPQHLFFSVGDSAEKAGLPRGLYSFLPLAEGLVNRHFKDITADGQVYCFETADRYAYQQQEKVNILIAMPDAKSLQIQKLTAESCGAGPWRIDKAAAFVR